MSELSSYNAARREIDQIYASIPAPENRVKSTTLETELAAAYDLLHAASRALETDQIATAWVCADRADAAITGAKNTIYRNRARARSTTS